MSKKRKRKSFNRPNYKRATKLDEDKSIRNRVLIVTEGKSEVSYFRAIKERGFLSNITVKPSSGSSPKNVILDAERICSDSFRKDFEQVFCVFDKDPDSNFSDSLELLRRLNKKSEFKETKFIAIPSVPCFEFWYLLHMTYTTRSFGGYPSPCDELVRELKKFPEFENYSKGSCDGLFGTLERNQEKAVSRAEKALKAAKQYGYLKYHEDPSTRIHLVIRAIFEHQGQ